MPSTSSTSARQAEADSLIRKGGEPLYQQLSDLLRKRVKAGDWAENDVFPTEVELSRAWSVSPYTVRQALSLLVDEGLLIRERGRGTFVRPLGTAGGADNENAVRYNRIALVMPWDRESFFAPLLIDVEEAAHHAGLRTMLVNNWNDANIELERVREVVDHGVDGLIWMCSADGPKPTALRYAKEHTPVTVFIDRAPAELADDVSLVTADNRGGMLQLVNHLLSKGRRRIAMASSQRQFNSTKDRERGYHVAMERAGIEVPEDWIFGTRNIGQDAGTILANRILQSRQRFDAICCSSDSVAVGVIKTLQAHGLRVPDDIAVTGFDDDPICSAFHPQLTTARIDLQTIAREATQLLIDQLNKAQSNEVISMTRLLVPVKTIVRESG